MSYNIDTYTVIGQKQRRDEIRGGSVIGILVNTVRMSR